MTPDIQLTTIQIEPLENLYFQFVRLRNFWLDNGKDAWAKGCVRAYGRAADLTIRQIKMIDPSWKPEEDHHADSNPS